MSLPERFRPAADRRTGSALVVVLIGMLMLSAIGLAMTLLATADTLASANQRDAAAALYAAEAGIEESAAELLTAPDWDGVLSGAVASARADGAPTGTRLLPDDRSMRLEEIANEATCGVAAGCSSAAREAVTADRPWGANNPVWHPYLYRREAAVGSAPPFYVVVLVGDDPAEIDGDPSRDGRAPVSPCAGVVMLRAEAFGPGGCRRIFEVIVARVAAASGPAALRFLAWREVR
jgi:hypothetical protein